MPVTQLDDRTALVVIDLQKGLTGFPTAHPFGDIVTKTARLAAAFRKNGMPVVLVNVTGMAPGRTDAARFNFEFPPDWADLIPELAKQESDHLVTKQRWGAFLGTGLDEYLRKEGVTQIVLTGVATSIGVESTARSAYDLGYNVALAVDAMTDMQLDAHNYCLENIFPRLGETGLTEDILKLLNTAK